jgi:hypothetical protein
LSDLAGSKLLKGGTKLSKIVGTSAAEVPDR